MPLDFRPLRLPEVIAIEPHRFSDQRGFFSETYKRSEFYAHGIDVDFVQDNHSRSVRGTLRGLHYQLRPAAQGKLVMALRGRVFDVAVDVRAGSPTRGQWVGLELSSKLGNMLYVPVGFAHGFCVLSDHADVLYKVTAEYAPELERGIVWNDPEIGVEWPLRKPLLSGRDEQLPTLAEADINFENGEELEAGRYRA
jgi:dTDP-4-dehydrorhamnose 3,5-epimerase